MPCWVAPAVAAELWGTPVAHVMARVEEGSIASKSEGGFLFVDILPTAEQVSPVAPLADDVLAPDTFMSVTDAEIAALTPAPETFTPVTLELTIHPLVSREDEPGRADDAGDSAEPFVDEETPTFSASDWRRVRAQTARTRKPPTRPAETAVA